MFKKLKYVLYITNFFYIVKSNVQVNKMGSIKIFIY